MPKRSVYPPQGSLLTFLPCGEKAAIEHLTQPSTSQVMTTEEKAKAYDEAFEKAKRLYEGKDKAPEEPILEYLFPQFCKSEDERIIQKLMWLLQQDICPFPEEEVTQMLAYLEKQKKLENMIVVSPEIWDNAISDAFENGKKEGEKQKEPNHEDEKHTDFTIYHPLKNGKGKYECIPYSFYGSLTSFSEDKDLIDFLRTCFYTKEECNEWIEQQKEQKQISKRTTVCGQDYKCKKDYKTGNCRYIKDAIYHCSRDGYLNDQNGVSWSCTSEWFNEYIQSNTEWAEEEKNRFVSGQFLQCKLSFDEFKEGEHYWLEYIGDDMYVGRSDNILNQKFHITPRQLYTLFSQQLEEKQKEEKELPLMGGNADLYFDEWNQQKQNPTKRQCFEEGMRYAQRLQKEQKPAEINVKALLAADRLASAEMTGRLKERSEILEDPERYGLKKPAEWSEEDKHILKGIIGKIDHDQTYGVSKVEMLSFLKSLRPQPHWKPSEEQMRALNEIICLGEISYVGQEEELIALRNKLKKLM